ncbi:hypothetical protein [Hyphomicrobium sp. CS1BSMeth3]|uniref:hypothetical protein n=1 Tax=Hyphomicrobium sp. CS1BSMeth3 TaxID=1892844 RepID=UPI000868B6A7|nr:hypothetical protein [Hyphomicrobium sp. CS1BSMeth3]ODT27721.1 MAG: hypothetical protein ABS54_05890 [Hyphomicrobium sp. SCN 65-11]
MTESLTQLIKENRTLAVVAVILLLLVFVPPVRAATKVALRILARILLLLALIALVSDGTRTIANDSGIVITSALQYWNEAAPTMLENLKRTLSLKIHPLFWDGLLVPLLSLPAWLVLSGTALLILYLARKRRETNIFANA